MNATGLITALGLALGATILCPAVVDEAAPPVGVLDRTVLTIPEPVRPTYTELDVRNAKPPAHVQVQAPSGAPNVLLVLIDDLGFAGTSTFGGPVGTPTFEQIADAGLA